MTRVNGGASRMEWVAPKLVELGLAVRDVENGTAPGTDGYLPGYPDTSQS